MTPSARSVETPTDRQTSRISRTSYAKKSSIMTPLPQHKKPVDNTKRLGSTIISVFNPQKTVESDTSSDTYYASKYELARENLMKICNHRNIDVDKVLQEYNAYSQQKINEHMTLKQFKTELINIGFQLCDLPDETIKIIGCNNNNYSLAVIMDLFQFEKQRCDVEDMKKKYSKEIDDLEFAQLEGDGVIHMKVVEARDLILSENVTRDDMEDYISWIYKPNVKENYKGLLKPFFNNGPFFFSGLQKCRLAANKYIEKENNGTLPELPLINKLQLSTLNDMLFRSYSFESWREMKKDFEENSEIREKSIEFLNIINQLKEEFSSLNVYMTSLNLSCCIRFLQKEYKGQMAKPSYNTFVDYFHGV